MHGKASSAHYLLARFARALPVLSPPVVAVNGRETPSLTANRIAVLQDLSPTTA